MNDDTPASNSGATLGEIPSGTVAAEALAERISRIERERNRVSRADWETLYRQISTLCHQLAESSFIRGDLEAESRLYAMLHASDLEEFDRRVDHLAEYVEAKLTHMAQLKADQTGTAPDEVPRLASRGLAAPGLTRMQSAAGPSGSDFILDTDSDAAGKRSAPRRGVLRL